jgi:zinc transporter ZupT
VLLQVLFNLHEPDHQHCHHGTHVPLLPCSFHDKLGSPNVLRRPLLTAAASLGEEPPPHHSHGRGSSSDALAQLGGGRQHSSDLGAAQQQQQQQQPAGLLEDGLEEQHHQHRHGDGAEQQHSLLQQRRQQQQRQHGQQQQQQEQQQQEQQEPLLLPSHAAGQLRYRHALMLMLALSAHTALESLALGFLADWHGFSVLLGAIASHKLISALALSTRFIKEGATAAQVVLFAGPFALVAPASILLGMYVGGLAPVAELALLCGATGTFLYIGTTEVLAEEFEESADGMGGWSPRAARHLKFVAVVLGVAAMAAASFLPEQ